MEGNLHFKIGWASLIVGGKFTVFALFYYVFEGKFPSISPQGAYISGGDLTEGFCVTSLGGLYLEGLIHEGEYFRNSTVYYIQNEGSACNCSMLAAVLIFQRESLFQSILYLIILLYRAFTELC